MKNTNKILIGVFLVLILIAGIFISSYNGLVSKESDVDAQWAQVENVMTRRADLIPNLVNSVQGSMDHEEKIFTAIADARTKYNNAGSPEAQDAANTELNSAVNTLVSVIQEDYPELASNENVKTLMVQLEGTENRISVERNKYIKEVNSYNKKVKRFPGSIFAGLFGFDEKEQFKATEDKLDVPVVEFGK